MYNLTFGHWADNLGMVLVLSVVGVEFVRLVSPWRNLNGGWLGQSLRCPGYLDTQFR